MNGKVHVTAMSRESRGSCQINNRMQPYALGLAAGRPPHAAGHFYNMNFGGSCCIDPATATATAMGIVGRTKAGVITTQKRLLNAIVPLRTGDTRVARNDCRTNSAGFPETRTPTIGFRCCLAEGTAPKAVEARRSGYALVIGGANTCPERNFSRGEFGLRRSY